MAVKNKVHPITKKDEERLKLHLRIPEFNVKIPETHDPHRPAAMLVFLVIVGLAFMFLFGLWLGVQWAG
jgi:hypothetical protein